MAYIRNQPVTNDDLDVSQPFLVTNTNGADDSFGIDHYKFSDTTANNGFHNKVTTPVFVDSPPTGNPPVTTTNPVFYGFQQTAPLGVLQYSRGPNNSVPTPVTYLQSPSTLISIGIGGTTSVLDFTGIKRAMATIYAADFSTNITARSARTDAIIFFNFDPGPPTLTTQILPQISVAGNLQPQFSGQILQLFNNTGAALSNVAWTLVFYRIEL